MAVQTPLPVRLYQIVPETSATGTRVPVHSEFENVQFLKLNIDRNSRDTVWVAASDTEKSFSIYKFIINENCIINNAKSLYAHM